MISCDKGKVMIKGSKPAIMSELTCLIAELVDEEDQVLTEDEITECVELAKLSDAELDSKLESAIQEASPEQLLNAMFATLMHH